MQGNPFVSSHNSKFSFTFGTSNFFFDGEKETFLYFYNFAASLCLEDLVTPPRLPNKKEH